MRCYSWCGRLLSVVCVVYWRYTLRIVGLVSRRGGVSVEGWDSKAANCSGTVRTGNARCGLPYVTVWFVRFRHFRLVVSTRFSRHPLLAFPLMAPCGYFVATHYALRLNLPSHSEPNVFSFMLKFLQLVWIYQQTAKLIYRVLVPKLLKLRNSIHENKKDSFPKLYREHSEQPCGENRIKERAAARVITTALWQIVASLDRKHAALCSSVRAFWILVFESERTKNVWSMSGCAYGMRMRGVAVSVVPIGRYTHKSPILTTHFIFHKISRMISSQAHKDPNNDDAMSVRYDLYTYI